MRRNILAAISIALVTALPLAFAAPGGGQGSGISHEAVEIELRLEGDATRTDGGPTAHMFYINATGDGTRQTPGGNGVQIWAPALEAQVVVVDGDGNEVENYTALVKFHASEASYLGQGLEGWRFQMQITGKRSDAILVNTANPDGRVLAMNAHGNTVGDPDDDGFFAVTGGGQTTTKTGEGGNSADHYNFELAGMGTIRSAE